MLVVDLEGGQDAVGNPIGQVLGGYGSGKGRMVENVREWCEEGGARRGNDFETYERLSRSQHLSKTPEMPHA